MQVWNERWLLLYLVALRAPPRDEEAKNQRD